MADVEAPAAGDLLAPRADEIRRWMNTSERLVITPGYARRAIQVLGLAALNYLDLWERSEEFTSAFLRWANGDMIGNPPSGDSWVSYLVFLATSKKDSAP